MPNAINEGVTLSLTIGGAVIGGLTAGPIGVASGAAMGKQVADVVIDGGSTRFIIYIVSNNFIISFLANFITLEINKVIEDN